MTRLILVVLTILISWKAVVAQPVSTPTYPATYTGTTNYVNESGGVVATSSWTVITTTNQNKASSPGGGGFIAAKASIKNLTSSCTLLGSGLGVWTYTAATVLTPAAYGLPGTWGVTNTSTGYTVPPGGTVTVDFTGSPESAILPSIITNVGFEFAQLRLPNIVPDKSIDWRIQRS